MSKQQNATNVIAMPNQNYIPDESPYYIPFGNFETVKNIIDSKRFYPIWITGLAGNGKTQLIEQACAKAKREFIRINFTTETDEMDLIGGIRLENGNTVFKDGPVVEALRRGAILLLDEVDIGHTNKIMCLQSVMEGKGVFIKATGEKVPAAPGFNIFATSNTKGKGSEDGRFIGTNIMNGAFLDRFAGTIYQDYPPPEVENKILKHYAVDYMWTSKNKTKTDVTKDERDELGILIQTLIQWANNIRKAFHDGAVQCEEVITTRTLINIIQGFAILGDKNKAIELACERYDENTKDALMDFYKKIDPTNVAVTSDIEEADAIDPTYASI